MEEIVDNLESVGFEYLDEWEIDLNYQPINHFLDKNLWIMDKLGSEFKDLFNQIVVMNNVHLQ
jgi:hypothetical protein